MDGEASLLANDYTNYDFTRSNPFIDIAHVGWQP